MPSTCSIGSFSYRHFALFSVYYNRLQRAINCRANFGPTALVVTRSLEPIFDEKKKKKHSISHIFTDHPLNKKISEFAHVQGLFFLTPLKHEICFRDFWLTSYRGALATVYYRPPLPFTTSTGRRYSLLPAAAASHQSQCLGLGRLVVASHQPQ